jgi:hypothetical protein
MRRVDQVAVMLGWAGAAGQAAAGLALRAVGLALIPATLWIGTALGQSRSGTIRVSATVADIAQQQVIGVAVAARDETGRVIGAGMGIGYGTGPALRLASGRSTEIGVWVDAVENGASAWPLPQVLVCPVTTGAAGECRTHAIPTGRLWGGVGNREVLVRFLPAPAGRAGDGGSAPVRLTVAYTGN